MIENISPWVYLAGITLLPGIELRGSIPVGVSWGMNPVTLCIVLSIVNALIVLPVFKFLDWFFHLIEKIPLADKYIKKTRKKAGPYVEKYGMIGLALFVAAPLPATGAYTGALAAHLFGMKNKKAFLSISAGVFIAGIIVTLIATAFKATLGWLLG